MPVGLDEERLHLVKLVRVVDLGDVPNLPPIGTNLDEQWVTRLSRQMDGEPEGVCHHREIGEDPGATEEHVSLASRDLHLPERADEGLSVAEDLPDLETPAPKYVHAGAGPAAMTLILACELAPATRADPPTH